MPEHFLRVILTLLLKCFFRVRVQGIEHFHNAGERLVVIANHQSFLDPLLLAVFLPKKPAFAMDVRQAKKWYFRPLLTLVDVYTIDPTQPMSTKSVIQRVQEGGVVVIFPEGKITTTGGVMKIYDGTGLILDKTDAPMLPVWVEGAKFSHLSRLQGKMRLKFFPRVSLTFFPARKLDIPASIQGKERRKLAAQIISDTLAEAAFRANFISRPLLAEITHAAKQNGWRRVIAEDINREPVTYRGLFTRMFVLARALSSRIGTQPNVGVLMPTSLGGVITFLALHALKRTPAMLNFSAGSTALAQAVEMAQVETVLTSRAFIERGELQEVVESLAARCRILYLEDLRAHVSQKDKLIGLAKSLCPTPFLPQMEGDAPAVILFTSGSEGAPKGVALSHANILANIHQAAARLAFTNRDILFNALPIFHSFGLSIGALLPLSLGIRVFLYPSPLHYRIIPELVYDTDATILLGTDTFFRGYAAYAHPFDFHSVRLAVAGAEKLKPETRALYAERFQMILQEGYGVTETAPALSFNTALESKPGSVGRLFPGIEARLEPVEGLASGGRLSVKGPNVMLGYIKLDRPGTVQPQGEWYDTGDIVEIDEAGYITIVGRAKRFAKIGGEMVSLAQVEELASRHWPEKAHAALATPDARKGEQITLISEEPSLTREAFLHHAQAAGLPEIALPRQVIHMDALPRLGSGKLDYVGLKEKVLAGLS